MVLFLPPEKQLIERHTKSFADARAALVEAATALSDELEQVRRKHLPQLKRAVAQVSAAQSLLTHTIEAAPHLFKSPRSIVLHGIKVGLQKSKPSVTWTDPRRVAELVNEHLPEQRDILVEVIYKPVVAALLQLDPEDRKKIGVRFDPGRDCVLIKPADGGVDKLVAALLKGIEDQAEDESEEVAG